MRAVWLVLLLVPALAQPLPEALKKAPDVPAVVTARLEYETRTKDLERTLQDPLRTALTELQARQAVALAEAKLERALAQARAEIVTAYTQALEATLQVRLAEKALEVAQLGLKAAQIRYNGGGATSLDLLEAQNRVLEARKNLEQAQRGQESALASQPTWWAPGRNA